MPHHPPTKPEATSPPPWQTPGPRKEEWKKNNWYTPEELKKMLEKDRGSFIPQKRKIPVI